MRSTFIALIMVVQGCSRSVSPSEIDLSTDTEIGDLSDLRLPTPPTETELPELGTDTEIPITTETDTETEELELGTDTEIPITTETDTETEELELGTDTDTDTEKDTCLGWVIANTCQPCFDCDACRHGDDEAYGCYGSVVHMGECDGYNFYLPDRIDPRDPDCDAFICCEELENDTGY